MRKCLINFNLAIFFIYFSFGRGYAAQIVATPLCNSETISVQCTVSSQHAFSLQVPANYTGDILYIGFSYNQPFSINIWGAQADPAPNLISLGSPCNTISSLSGSYTLFLPAGNPPCSNSGGYFVVEIVTTAISGCGGQQVMGVTNLVSPNPCLLPCSDCLPSFSPEPDSAYIISAWIKQSNFLPSTTSYSDAHLGIAFDNLNNVNNYYASGQIIDGWQRIEGEFVVPQNAGQFYLVLESGGTAWFDDIRIYPKNGSMKTYVFDPVTLRLTAELDERNYATIYEYDEDGHLTRVKKETERGIMTIQENKIAIAK